MNSKIAIAAVLGVLAGSAGTYVFTETVVNVEHNVDAEHLAQLTAEKIAAAERARYEEAKAEAHRKRCEFWSDTVTLPGCE
jgi:hypothetical protein